MTPVLAYLARWARVRRDCAAVRIVLVPPRHAMSSNMQMLYWGFAVMDRMAPDRPVVAKYIPAPRRRWR
jgi:hypothetical protein